MLMHTKPARSAIQVRQLTKSYAGGVEAVKGLDFDVAAGENVELSLKTTHPKVPVIKVPVVLPPRPAVAH